MRSPPCKSHVCLVVTGVNCPEHQCTHSQRLGFLWYVCVGEWQACAYVNEVCETVAIVNTDPREWVTVVRFMCGIAEDTLVLDSVCATRKGRAGSGWKAGNVIGGDLPRCIMPRLW